jgi:hypothetical protein
LSAKLFIDVEFIEEGIAPAEFQREPVSQNGISAYLVPVAAVLDQQDAALPRACQQVIERVRSCGAAAGSCNAFALVKTAPSWPPADLICAGSATVSAGLPPVSLVQWGEAFIQRRWRPGQS